MPKKWTILMFIAAIMLILAACSGTSTQKQETTKTDSSTTSTKPNEKEGTKAMTNSFPQLAADVTGNEREVEMQTSMGTIKMKLFPEYAPKAVENFVKHSEEGYYNGLTFHRVIKDFMIQGGDPSGNGTGGESIYGHSFEDEFSDHLYNIRGALSMANSGPNTNGSQFFIVQSTKVDPSMVDQMKKAGYPDEIIAAYEKNGGTPWLDHHYTVFGQVVEGMDIVDKIARTPVDAQDKPKENVTIDKIIITK